MTFVLVLGRNGKTCVLPAFIEADLLRSKSVGGGKYELQYNEEKLKDMQQHLKEHCSLKLHLSTCRPRGKTRRRALCVCAHRLRKMKEDNHPKFSGPEGQKVHEKRNPDEVRSVLWVLDCLSY